MVEQYSGLFLAGVHIKIITHHQDDINVIGVGFGSDIAPKENKAFQFACGVGKLVDTPQAGCGSLSLRSAVPELSKNFVHRCLVHAFG